MPFDLHLAGLETSAKIGDAIELKLTTIKNPVSGAEVRIRVSDRIEYDHSGTYSAIAPFEYSAP